MEYREVIDYEYDDFIAERPHVKCDTVLMATRITIRVDLHIQDLGHMVHVETDPMIILIRSGMARSAEHIDKVLENHRLDLIDVVKKAKYWTDIRPYLYRNKGIHIQFHMGS